MLPTTGTRTRAQNPSRATSDRSQQREPCAPVAAAQFLDPQCPGQEFKQFAQGSQNHQANQGRGTNRQHGTGLGQAPAANGQGHDNPVAWQPQNTCGPNPQPPKQKSKSPAENSSISFHLLP